MHIAAVKGPLDEFQTIERGEQDANGGGDGQADAHPIRAEQNQEFADKIAQSRQPDRSHGQEHGHTAEAWDGLPKPAPAIHFAGVNAFLPRETAARQSGAVRKRQSSAADPPKSRCPRWALRCARPEARYGPAPWAASRRMR